MVLENPDAVLNILTMDEKNKGVVSNFFFSVILVWLLLMKNGTMPCVQWTNKPAVVAAATSSTGGAESASAMPAQESDVKLKELCNPADPMQIYEQMTKIGEG